MTNIILTPAQAQIAEDRHRFRVLRCGRRFGKTRITVEEINGVALFMNARICYIAPTYQQARDIAWEMLIKRLGESIISTNESRLEVRTRNSLGGESFILLRGWESIDNVRGQAFDLLAIDEVAMMKNFWTGWNEVLRPTLTDRKGQAVFSSTPKGYDHFYDLCNMELKDSDYRTFHFTTYDNPHIPVEEIEAAKASLPEEVFGQEYLADFHKKQGLVYKEFSRTFHTYTDLPNKAFELLGGVDFGYRNPAGVLHIYSDGEYFYVDDEWYKRERTDSQVVEYVSGCGFKAVYPDPENPSAIEELRRKRVNIREVSKGRGSVSSGIQAVRELLITKRLKVNKRCLNLISEFEMYSYDDDKLDRNEKEDPVKAHDHLLDALRYVVTTYRPVDKIANRQTALAHQTHKKLTETTR
jgi:PBSX family phage terminase large subunit